MSDKTLAEIHDDLLAYLNDDECVDPIGYLETVQLELQTAIAALDTAELAHGAAPTSPPEPVPSTPRVWAMPEIPEDVTRLRDGDGDLWTRSDGFWESVDPDNGQPLARFVPDDVLISSYSPLTEVEETNDGRE